MKSLARGFGLSVLAVALFGAAPAATAGVDISFGVHAPIGNDGDLFFNISSRYFDRPMTVVDTWGRRFGNPDDLAVFLHICRYSHVGPDIVFSYRKQGMSWYDIGMRVGVPTDRWYVAVPDQPGPPYGKAYGYWKKHKQNPDYVVRLSDKQCRDLVAVRMAHEYYGVPPQTAMDWRRDGTRVNEIMTREYRTRHDGGRDRDEEDGDHRGHGRGNEHGHDKHGNH